MTFPPDPEREPRRAKAWTMIREMAGRGEVIELDRMVEAVAEVAQVQPKAVGALVSSAKRAGWAKFERRDSAAEPWRVRFDFERCLVCGQPRGPESHAEPRSQESAVDASAAAFIGGVRRALGREGWLDSMAVVGLVAALGPIEPEELSAAAVEFRPGVEHSFKAVIGFLDEIGLVELDVTTDPSKVYYRMAD